MLKVPILCNTAATAERFIKDLKQTDAAAERRRSHSNLYSIDVKGRLNSLGLESF